MPEYVTCYYCLKQIKTRDSHNADDWIHPDTVWKRCCAVCNDTIVIPNRILAMQKGENNGYKGDTRES